MTEKRYTVRGMTLDEIMKLVAAAIDELVDENEELFRISMMDGGVPIEAADACIESRRAEKTAWRVATFRNAAASARRRASK
ncbi:MAG: hypothetical protein WA704_22730 [Pseudolabrys sp.]